MMVRHIRLDRRQFYLFEGLGINSLHLAIGCLPTYDCIVSGWRENLRESLSQTGIAVIFHPARRIVIVPFLGEV